MIVNTRFNLLSKEFKKKFDFCFNVSEKKGYKIRISKKKRHRYYLPCHPIFVIGPPYARMKTLCPALSILEKQMHNVKKKVEG